MTQEFSYSTARWRAISAQARARDEQRCTVARLLGGDCSPHLHAHHLIPVGEDDSRVYDINNVVTACAKHHPRLEALRRFVLQEHEQHEEPRPRCPHHHPYPGGREACERRLARQQQVAA